MDNGPSRCITSTVQPATPQVRITDRGMSDGTAAQRTKRVRQVRNRSQPHETDGLKLVDGVVVVEEAGHGPACRRCRFGHNGRMTSASKQQQRRLAGHAKRCPCTAGRTGGSRGARGASGAGGADGDPG